MAQLNLFILALYLTNMKKIWYKVVAGALGILTFICLPLLVSAQSDPGCAPDCNCRLDMSICPIDNSVWILLVIGALYGVKKIRDARKKPLAAS